MPAQRISMLAAFLITLVILWGCDRHASENSFPRGATPSPGTEPEAIAEPQVGCALFFYDRGCPDCLAIKNSLLVPFLEKIEVAIEDVKWLDVSKDEVAREVLRLEKAMGFNAHALAPIIIARGRAYCVISAVQRTIQGE